MLIVSFPQSQKLAKNIAHRCNAKFSLLQEHDFPDGESLVKIPPIQKEIVVIAQLDHPNPKILPLIFALSTLRELGAKKITLVVPYMPYLRQDARFHAGEAVSNHIFTGLFCAYADRVITIDPHLHRVSRLKDLFAHGTRLTAVGPIANFIRKHYPKAIVIGPDEESFQWAEDVARLAKTKASVLLKKRFDDEHVAVSHIKESLQGRTVIIVDDIISSGHTMMEVVKQAKHQGAKKIICIGVHGIFADHADRKLKRLGAKVVTCDTIPHRTNAISVEKLIADSL